MLTRRPVLAALAVALAFTPAAPALARRAAHHAAMGSWDGRWAGSWGGNDPTAINVSGGKVVSYEYGGQTNAVSSSHVTATRIVYGKDNIVVTMTRTGRNTAHATIKTSQGNGTAELARQ